MQEIKRCGEPRKTNSTLKAGWPKGEALPVRDLRWPERLGI